MDQLNKTVVDNTVDGSLVRLTYSVASILLEQITNQHKGWHILDTKVAMGSPTTSIMNKEPKEERRRVREKYDKNNDTIGPPYKESDGCTHKNGKCCGIQMI